MNKLLLLVPFIFLLLFLLKKEKFSTLCIGARNGVSGCRDCCKNNMEKKNYNTCVNTCMQY